MKFKKHILLSLVIGLFFNGLSTVLAQLHPMVDNPDRIKIYPKESDALLSNPGIGFTTFQRFNGDSLNTGIGWTEGYPIEYQDFDGDITNKSHPQTTIAYFRVNWRFLETAPGQYNWKMIDKALKTAAERGQTLILRISPYEGIKDKDVPAWYRKIVGKEKDLDRNIWVVDPENPAYVKYFGGMVEALGQRYDGHPDLEGVDISFIGYWGEGSGTMLLTEKTRVALIDAYMDNFENTHLFFLPLNGDDKHPKDIVKGTRIAASWADGTNNGTGTEMRTIGWRVDCIGDMDFFSDLNFNHMLDVYPQGIVKSGLQDAWKKAPISLEICGTFLRWMEQQKYDEKTVKYIFDQALKWHISSFNAKSSAIPKAWSPLVDAWLKKMGYRFVTRKFSYPAIVNPQGQILIKTWFENKGVAPIYKDYKFAVRLKNDQTTKVFLINENIKKWLPGDIVFEEKLYLPYNMPLGEYKIEIAIVDPVALQPRVKLAIEGVNKDGWYTMGNIKVEK